MKGIPDFPPTVFHRIRPSTYPVTLDGMIAKRTSGSLDTELAREFSMGHGLLVASWTGGGSATVEALGVVVEVSASGQRKVEWTRGPIELPMPDMGGGSFWSQPKPTFRFAKNVAEGLGLKEFFGKHVKDPFAASRGTTS